MSVMPDEMIGTKFGRLTVLEQAGVNKHRSRLWKCVCDCGSEVVVSTPSLRSGNTKSCGCLHKDSMKEAGAKHRAHNLYDLSQPFGIGFTSDGRRFFFDKEDYPLIAKYTWSFNDQGYVISCPYGETVRLHRLVMNAPRNTDVHHINQCPEDNRKANLECVSHARNIQLSKRSTANTSGFRGVSWDKAKKKWLASIACNGKAYFLGRFEAIEDAVEARRQGELKYFGEVLPDPSR